MKGKLMQKGNSRFLLFIALFGFVTFLLSKVTVNRVLLHCIKNDFGPNPSKRAVIAIIRNVEVMGVKNIGDIRENKVKVGDTGHNLAYNLLMLYKEQKMEMEDLRNNK